MVYFSAQSVFWNKFFGHSIIRKQFATSINIQIWDGSTAICAVYCWIVSFHSRKKIFMKTSKTFERSERIESRNIVSAATVVTKQAFGDDVWVLYENKLCFLCSSIKAYHSIKMSGFVRVLLSFEPGVVFSIFTSPIELSAVSRWTLAETFNLIDSGTDEWPVLATALDRRLHLLVGRT